jgi:2,5-diketo-D-gluconate reductase B
VPGSGRRAGPTVPPVRTAGVEIPAIGLGTWRLSGTACTAIVAEALALGYRHLDTAEMYGNEREVGEGVRASGVPREAVFVTTKVLPDHLEPKALLAAAEASLARLGLGYADLYLIHWPNPAVPLELTIDALCEVRRRGLARAIGVANFPSALVDRAAALATEPLAANQVEYHPFLSQQAVIAACRAHGMAVTAYCPLARGRVAESPVVRGIAEAHGATPGQVALAWLVGQPGVAAIPKTATPARLAENLAAAAISLTADEMAAIHALARPDGRLLSPTFAPAWDRA